jgi:hypothetical protein
MSTFNDLETEVRKLRKKVRRLEVRRLEGGNPAVENATAVAEIVTERATDGDYPSRKAESRSLRRERAK